MAELFYPIGIVLAVLAVVISFFGLRTRDWPGSGAAMAGGLAIFAVLVLAATATAVINAREEQEHRANEEAELAAEEAELEKEAEQAEEVGEPGGGAAGEQLEQDAAGGSEGAGSSLELSAPEDGSLAFDTDSLEASAGEVTIAFTNPAQVSHDVAIESSDAEELAKSDLVSDGDSTEVSTDLEAGDYTFYCTVPGHREGGMEGTLTVE